MKYIKEIICSTTKEGKQVLEKLEKQGYKWNDGGAATKYCSNFLSIYKPCGLQLWNDKTITYSQLPFEFGNATVTAKEFLGKDECIVIYRNGSETIAFNKVTKEKAVAKCSPSDTYDFMTGAKLALERLTGKEEKLGFKPHLEFCGENYGVIGEKTLIQDAIGRNLRVGDTVELYSEDNIYQGERVVVYKREGAFVLGIMSSCRTDGTIVNGWKIILKRRYEQIVDGERASVILYVKEEKTSKD